MEQSGEYQILSELLGDIRAREIIALNVLAGTVAQQRQQIEQMQATPSSVPTPAVVGEVLDPPQEVPDGVSE